MSETETNSYRAVKQVIVDRLRAGLWAPGDQLPNEADLAREFGCARATVNRALRELAGTGLLERRRKAGTRVARRTRRTVRVEIPQVREEVEARGSAYGYMLLKRAVLPAPDMVRARLNLSSGAAALFVECLHSADGNPFQFERRWINLEAVPDASGEPFDVTGPNEWLLKTIPFSDAEHAFSAANADEREAELFGLSVRDALLIVERRTWLDGAAITWVRMAYPGASHRVVAVPAE